jgi:hypothetical protein
MIIKILVFFFFFSGLITLYAGFRDIITVNSINNWPHVEGLIVKSMGKRLEIRNVGGDNSSKTILAPDIQYEYSVESVFYSSNQLSIGGVVSNDNTKYYMNKYPVNMKVKVYYRPSDHSFSVLESGHSFSSFIFVFIGLLFLIFSFILVRK